MSYSGEWFSMWIMKLPRMILSQLRLLISLEVKQHMLVDVELLSVRARRTDFQIIDTISLVFLRQESSPLSPLLCHHASLLCQPTVLLLGVVPINQPDPEPLPSCCLLLIYLNFVIHTNLHVLDFLLAFFSFHALDKAIEQNIPVFHISFPF